MCVSKSTFYIVGIPIGNIYDFSQRALFILNKVDFILSENIKKSFVLLNKVHINNKIIRLNKFNEFNIKFMLYNKIKYGMSIALISDAGTPIIHDPGSSLVNFLNKKNIKIISIPGACSVVSSLSVSGFYINSYIFEGFLPKDLNKKKFFIFNWINENKVIIFYESSFRILETIFILRNILKINRNIVLIKNISKKFERIFKTSIFNLLNMILYKKFNINGEFIIILGLY